MMVQLLDVPCPTLQRRKLEGMGAGMGAGGIETESLGILGVSLILSDVNLAFPSGFYIYSCEQRTSPL